MADVIEHNGLTGAAPIYNTKFFFKKGYETSDLIGKGKKKTENGLQVQSLETDSFH